MEPRPDLLHRDLVPRRLTRRVGAVLFAIGWAGILVWLAVGFALLFHPLAALVYVVLCVACWMLLPDLSEKRLALIVALGSITTFAALFIGIALFNPEPSVSGGRLTLVRLQMFLPLPTLLGSLRINVKAIRHLWRGEPASDAMKV